MLFKHEHTYHIVRKIFHPDRIDADANEHGAYYEYKRDEYHFCIECGQLRPDSIDEHWL